MENCGFAQGVEVALRREPRFARAVFFFLRDALEHTVAQQGKDDEEARREQRRDVRGQQLALGFRDYSLLMFGPMASVVLEEWGIHRSEDVGEIVYLLIELGVFGRSEEDQENDFAEQWNQQGAFIDPYLPPSAWKASSANSTELPL